jgi:hypothetical protein
VQQRLVRILQCLLEVLGRVPEHALHHARAAVGHDDLELIVPSLCGTHESHESACIAVLWLESTFSVPDGSFLLEKRRSAIEPVRRTPSPRPWTRNQSCGIICCTTTEQCVSERSTCEEQHEIAEPVCALFSTNSAT